MAIEIMESYGFRVSVETEIGADAVLIGNNDDPEGPQTALTFAEFPLLIDVLKKLEMRIISGEFSAPKE